MDPRIYFTFPLTLGSDMTAAVSETTKNDWKLQIIISFTSEIEIT